jgi:hypothetical protein
VQGTTILAGLALTLALIVPRASRADGGASEEARAAYDRGAAAHARGDYRVAASEMARADALAPNPVALKAALDEVLLADDPELGMQLVERARLRAPGDPTLAPSVRDATARFAGRTGKVRVDCGGRTCRASIDGRQVDLLAPVTVLVGSHQLAIDAGGGVTTREVTVSGDRETVVVLPPAEPLAAVPRPVAPGPLAARSRAAPSRGPSSVWFFTAAAVTAVAGGVTIASGIDTANQHASFVSRGCGAPGGAADCATISSDGIGAQTRTNVLAVTTGVLGVATLALAFVVEWHLPAAERASLVVGDRSASLRVRF